jgi:hypothetical protein
MRKIQKAFSEIALPCGNSSARFRYGCSTLGPRFERSQSLKERCLCRRQGSLSVSVLSVKLQEDFVPENPIRADSRDKQALADEVIE